MNDEQAATPTQDASETKPRKSLLSILGVAIAGGLLGLAGWLVVFQTGPLYGLSDEVLKHRQVGMKPDPVADVMLTKANNETVRKNLMYYFAVLSGLLAAGLAMFSVTSAPTRGRRSAATIIGLVFGAVGAVAVAPLAASLMERAHSEPMQIAGQAAILACLGLVCGLTSHSCSGSLKVFSLAGLAGIFGGALGGMLFFVVSSLAFPYAVMYEAYSSQPPVAALWSVLGGLCISLGIAVGIPKTNRTAS